MVPRTLDDARKLVSTPSPEEEGALALTAEETEGLRASTTREDRVLTLLAGHDFGDLDDRQAEAMALEHLAQPTRAATALSRAVLQCYYRDERVLRSVGHEPTPPYPRGNTVEQGDWSLLEQVKSLPPLWRDDRGF